MNDDIPINNDLISFYENKNYIDIAKYIANKYCNFTENEINFIDRFWDCTFNKKWLYLSKEMIVENFGYANSIKTMDKFYDKQLYKNFQVNSDYKKISKEEYTEKYFASPMEDPEKKTDKRGGHNKLYYIITGECYKSILMLVQTEKGKEIRQYYIKIEELAQKTYKIISLIMN